MLVFFPCTRLFIKKKEAQKKKKRTSRTSKRPVASTKRKETDADRALAALKRKRKQKEKEEEEAAEREEEGEEQEDVYDAETSEDDLDMQTGKRGKEYGRDEYYSEEEEEEERPLFKTRTPLLLKNVRKLQIKRKHFGKLLEKPFLERFVQDKFTRVVVGTRSNGMARFVIL